MNIFKTISTKIKGIINPNKKQEDQTVSDHGSTQDVETNSTDSMNDETFNNLIYQVSSHYKMDAQYIKERYELCRKLFNLSRDEFIIKIQMRKNLLTCTDEKLLAANDQLQQLYLNTKLNPKKFIMTFDTFPDVKTNVIAYKINRLSEVGITKYHILKNPTILKYDVERLRIRAKLAYLNNIHIDYFLDAPFKIPEGVVWSRIQAKKEGLIPASTNIYTTDTDISILTGLSPKQLLEKYPLSSEDLESISEEFLEKTMNGIDWNLFDKPATTISRQSRVVSHKGFVNNATFSNDERINNRVVEIAKAYNVPMTFILKRQKLCKELFGISKEDFLYRLNSIEKQRHIRGREHLYDGMLTCSNFQLAENKNNITKLGFSQEQIIKAAKVDARFPYYPLEKTNEKITYLEQLGLTRDDVLNNIEIIYYDKDRLDKRLKIAFIKNHYIDSYLEHRRYKLPEDKAFARMEANRRGFIKSTFIYLPECEWQEATGYSSKELMDIYPYNEYAIETIDGLYNYFVKNGRTWPRMKPINANNINGFDEMQ